jgi:primosomal protein N' (replication factor Y)
VSDEQLTIGPRKRVRPAAPITEDRPVARLAVDTGVPHLDRPFDYLVPEKLAAAEPGCRVRVRFSGRLVDGIVLERLDATDHEGRLAPLQSLVSPEAVLTPELAALARVVADRSAGTLYDVLRLALPPRHARVEAEPAGPSAAPPATPAAGSWERYPAGPAFLRSLADGHPRAVLSALPGGTWTTEVALAVQATVAAGRGAVVVVPDARDVARVSAALEAVPHVALRADLGPAERYRRWLAVRRGEVQAVVGTRAAAFAPVADLGLVVVWDDGDDLHREPRSPYVHVRDLLVQRAHLAGAAALVGGFARTAEAQLLVESGWAKELGPHRDALRSSAPRVTGTSEDDQARDAHAQAARIPGLAFEAARTALKEGAPVLVQVPRRGYVPSLSCTQDRTPARCAACAGPLQLPQASQVPACRWCGHLAADWTCPLCGGRRLRAAVVGAARTAEELGRAFPGVVVRTSGRDEVLDDVPDEPALVISTPGAEPVAPGGYGAVLLLDAWSVLTRADLRAGEEALRRWMAAAALARPRARVVVVAEHRLPVVQALVRWDPAGAAARELADRAALGFPPATRMASVTGSPHAVADLLAGLEVGEVLGPVPVGEDERAFVRVPRAEGAALAAALKAAAGVRSARKAEPVRIELDPHDLV